MSATPMDATPAPATAGSLTPRIRSALFAAATRPPAQAPRWMLWSITALIALLALWTVFAHLDIVAVAQGRLVPQTYVKIVQPAAGGIVREILVREGDAVAAGQILVRLDPTEVTADRTAVERELATERLQLRRIDAELADGAPEPHAADDPALFGQANDRYRANRQAYRDATTQQQAVLDRAEQDLAAGIEVMRKLELTQPSYRRTVEAYEKLEAKNLVGAIQAEEVRREALENRQNLEAQRATVASLHAAVNEASRKLAQIGSAYKSDLQAERTGVQSRVTELEQQQVKAAFQQSHLELKAPQAGIVKELATTTIGAVVQPGTVLVSLVPQDEPLLAEVLIDNQDIAFVRAGQPVRLKLASYPFQRYGMLDGVVKTLIADAQARARTPEERAADHDNEGGMGSTMAFKATIALRDQTLNLDGTPLPLAAGMQVSAEIVEGRRTVLQYLLSPVRRVASEAGMER